MGGNADDSPNAIISELKVNCSTAIINCADSGPKFKSLSIEAAGWLVNTWSPDTFFAGVFHTPLNIGLAIHTLF